MQKLLNKLLDVLGVDMSVVQSWDGETGIVNLPLGKIDAGVYSNGLWGDVTLLETDAVLTFMCGDIYSDDEFNLGEGTVNLEYAPDNKGLAYTNELEDYICARIREQYGIEACGSEQGMQGDEYLSLDIWHKALEVENNPGLFGEPATA